MEAEMYRYFSNWMEDASESSPISIEKEAEVLMVYIDGDTAVDILSSSVENNQQEIDDWREIAEFSKFKTPYYGWDGFEVSAAADRLQEELPAEITR
jgi:glycine cleavage system aminomethyltransferase T